MHVFTIGLMSPGFLFCIYSSQKAWSLSWKHINDQISCDPIDFYGICHLCKVYHLPVFEAFSADRCYKQVFLVLHFS